MSVGLGTHGHHVTLPSRHALDDHSTERDDHLDDHSTDRLAVGDGDTWYTGQGRMRREQAAGFCGGGGWPCRVRTVNTTDRCVLVQLVSLVRAPAINHLTSANNGLVSALRMRQKTRLWGGGRRACLLLLVNTTVYLPSFFIPFPVCRLVARACHSLQLCFCSTPQAKVKGSPALFLYL